jgi:D-glycero-D-manno-heptose 1,7-bisphosphate phosphatase
LLLTAACEHEIDLAASWMIGDSEIDIEAGRNAGCRTVRLLGSTEPSKGSADVVASSLLEAVHLILQREEVIAQQQAIATTQQERLMQ